MGIESFVKHLLVDIGNCDFLLFYFLGPENRDRPSQLHMWKNKVLRGVLNYHLCLDTVGGVSLFIQTPWVKSGSSHFKPSPRYEHQVCIFAQKPWLVLLTVSLDYLKTPGFCGHILEHKVFQNVWVPDVAIIRFSIHLSLLLEALADI